MRHSSTSDINIALPLPLFTKFLVHHHLVSRWQTQIQYIWGMKGTCYCIILKQTSRTYYGTMYNHEWIVSVVSLTLQRVSRQFQSLSLQHYGDIHRIALTQDEVVCFEPALRTTSVLAGVLVMQWSSYPGEIELYSGSHKLSFSNISKSKIHHGYTIPQASPHAMVTEVKNGDL